MCLEVGKKISQPQTQRNLLLYSGTGAQVQLKKLFGATQHHSATCHCHQPNSHSSWAWAQIVSEASTRVAKHVAMLARSPIRLFNGIRSLPQGCTPRFWALKSTVNGIGSMSTRAGSLAQSERNACQIVPGFLSEALAATARRHYDSRFADGRNTEERHFGFDLWHIEGSFTAFRTPAVDFFGDVLWVELETSLVAFGRRELGCQAITPPWLSVYLDGCEQRLHTDVW